MTVPTPPTDAWLAAHSSEYVRTVVPRGALKLGCTGCKVMDWLRHPEIAGRMYCWGCPVSRQRRAMSSRPSAAP